MFTVGISLGQGIISRYSIWYNLIVHNMAQTKGYPDLNVIYPIENVTRTAFLKNIVKHPQIIIGDYTYYDDPEDVHNFEKNVLYLFEFIQDKLVIGKFCQIATAVKFIMNGANHAMDGVSTYPEYCIKNFVIK